MTEKGIHFRIGSGSAFSKRYIHQTFFSQYLWIKNSNQNFSKRFTVTILLITAIFIRFCRILTRFFLAERIQIRSFPARSGSSTATPWKKLEAKMPKNIPKDILQVRPGSPSGPSTGSPASLSCILFYQGFLASVNSQPFAITVGLYLK